MNKLLARLASSALIAFFLFASPVRLASAPVLTDLEAMAQDFVLETVKIEIPEYPDAFNPTLIRWQNAMLMFFRFRDPLTLSTDGIGYIRLDDSFKPEGPPKVLRRPAEGPGSKAQDPRLIAVGDSLFMVYSNVFTGSSGNELRRVVIADLYLDGADFYAGTPVPLLQNDSGINKPIEKNWTPFDYQGRLLLAYSILPHRIMLYTPGSIQCETVALSSGNIQWNWGDLRGGTTALKHGNEYLAFFHSSKEMFSAHSNGKKMSHYFMGAYTFSSAPPFAITKVSPEPIIAKRFYTGPVYQTWKPLRVVFPGGFVYDKDSIWIAYGRQDHELWVVRLDKKGLLASLIPVTTLD